MATLDDNWVTPAPEGIACQRCEGKEDVLALKLIFDVPRYICAECLEEAATIGAALYIAGTFTKATP